MKRIGLLAVFALALLAFSGGHVYAQSNTITVTMHAQNGSGEDGTATITDMGGGQVQVVLNLTNAPADPQPAHIHKGTCANLDPVPAFPLTNAVGGQSTTTVGTSLSSLTSGQYAINVHKSAAEVKTYFSCGDIMAMATQGGGTGTTSGTSAPGMPTTGNSDQTLLVAIVLLALSAAAAGVKLSRHRI